jgi:hypothetical protein
MEKEMDKRMVMVPVPEYLVTDVYRFIVAEEDSRMKAIGETKEESGMKATGEEQDGSGPQQSEQWRYSYA